MNTIQTLRVSAGEQFLLLHIQSMLTYAQSDPTFAAQLLYAVNAADLPAISEIKNIVSSAYTLPTDSADALNTAQWVLHTLATHPEYKTATNHLAHWAQNYESPKDVVLGIVGLAIIGPTLGIVSTKKKKKRKSQMVVVDTYLKKLTAHELAQLSTQLSQRVIAQELSLAGGNVYNLHPDSAAWCIEEAQNKIYVDTKANVQSLQRTAASNGLSHTVETDSEGNIVAIVISPSVNDSLVEDSSAQSV